MTGFLSQIKRKKVRTGSMAADLLLQSSTSLIADRRSGGATEVAKDPQRPATTIVTTNSKMGEGDSLLADLLKESKDTKTQSPTPSAGPISGSTRQLTRTSGTSRVRIVASGDTATRKKKADVFDEALPWWLTEPIVSSPQVDILVPAARMMLNELIADGVKRDELPTFIQRAANLAVTKLAGEMRFSQKDIQDAISELTSLMLGKGPLQTLYDDPAVTDIYMDGHDSIKCVRRGQAVETPFRYRSVDEYESAVTNMLQSVDRVLNMSSPIVDCVLKDQWRSRLNAVHSSLRDGGSSSVVIRIPRLQQITFYDLLQTKTLPATVAAWLAELVSSGQANILVMGPTGSGKTTFTTALLSAVGSDERICTIEDVPEIFVPTAHLEKLVSRPENSQGEGEVGMHQLLRAALRRAPHRIVVGEIRDKEGPLFLKALETGHAGSVATIHAESPRDGLWRLLDVVAAIEKAPQESIQRRIGRGLHILISMRKVNGRPCLIDISEVRPPVGGEFVVTTLVKYEGEEGGRRNWRIMANHSHWLDFLASRGMTLQPGPSLLPMEKVQDRVTT